MNVISIDKTQNYNRPAFRALKLNYDIESTLVESADTKLISKFFEAGRKLEGTQFFDLEVLSDLTMRIKEKGNPFSGLLEPIKIYRHKPNQLRISGIYDGVEDEYGKPGQKKSMYLRYDEPNIVNKILDSVNSLKGILRLTAITKLLDDYYVKTKSGQEHKTLSKQKIVSVLMTKYGDIVK